MALVLFSVDGMRPDALSPERTPAINGLMSRGAWTLKARTVMPSVTLPCHSSMLRGVDVPRHGITSNVFQPLARPVPSVLDLAHRAGLRTGFFYNWGELRDLCEPGSLDVGVFFQDAHRPQGDARVAAAAVDHQRETPFDLLFVYLGYVDECGHQHGWMSPEYLEAVAHADRCIGQVLEATPSYDVLVVSDHGGHGRSHGTEMDEDMTIPFVLAGDGVTVGEIGSTVRVFDVAPTVAARLGLPPAREWDGNAIATSGIGSASS